MGLMSYLFIYICTITGYHINVMDVLLHFILVWKTHFCHLPNLTILELALSMAKNEEH